MKNRKARHGIYQINYFLDWKHVEMINRYCYSKNLLSKLNISIWHWHSFKICKCIAKFSYHWCWLINLIVQWCGVFTLMFLYWYMYILQWWYISYRICDIPQRFLWDTCVLTKYFIIWQIYLSPMFTNEQELHLNDFIPTK